MLSLTHLGLVLLELGLEVAVVQPQLLQTSLVLRHLRLQLRVDVLQILSSITQCQLF